MTGARRPVAIMAIDAFGYPRGASKSNEIAKTWRGRPLGPRLPVIELIASTTTLNGLRVRSALDTSFDAFHPE